MDVAAVDDVRLWFAAAGFLKQRRQRRRKGKARASLDGMENLG